LDLNKDKKLNQWEEIKDNTTLSTKEKLDKLVKLNLKKKSLKEKKSEINDENKTESFDIIESVFSLEEPYGDIRLSEWGFILPESIAVVFQDESLKDIDTNRFLFFDTETTGLSVGTGTIPFMLGFGYFDDKYFKTKIFLLNDMSAENNMLEAVDDFIKSGEFTAIITYNGKSYDFPLMENRYILNRRRFPLLKLPHLDFLYPARIIWKNTFDSRRLGYLGEMLLGISREEDIDGSRIPALYFSYVRTGNYSLIETVVKHNELDLVGLAALVLKGVKYIENIENTDDEGEILGICNLYEKCLKLETAEEKYSYLIDNAEREEIKNKAIKRLSVIKKKRKLYDEAVDLWEKLSSKRDIESYRELAIYYEHREKNLKKALKYAVEGYNDQISENMKIDLIKRIDRLKLKIKKIEGI